MTGLRRPSRFDNDDGGTMRFRCDNCGRVPEEHSDSDAGPMSVCPVVTSDEVEPETDPGRILGSNYRLGYAFTYGGRRNEKLHREALRDAAAKAKHRERNYDQPWWAANMEMALNYIEALEHALRPQFEINEET